MPTDCVIAAGCYLFYGCKNSFAQKVILDAWSFTAHPLIQMIVFLCCSWPFSTFNHNSCPFLYSSFSLKVWISLSIIYRKRSHWHELPPSPIYIFLYIDAPLPPPKCKGNNWMPPLLFLCNIWRKKWLKMTFCMQINIKVSYHLILTLFPSKFCTRW